MVTVQVPGSKAVTTVMDVVSPEPELEEEPPVDVPLLEEQQAAKSLSLGGSGGESGSSSGQSLLLEQTMLLTRLKSSRQLTSVTPSLTNH